MGIRNQKESNGEETSLRAGGYLLSIHRNALTHTCILILQVRSYLWGSQKSHSRLEEYLCDFYRGWFAGRGKIYSL